METTEEKNSEQIRSLQQIVKKQKCSSVKLMFVRYFSLSETRKNKY